MKCNVLDCNKTLLNLCYQEQKNGTKHLMGRCLDHGIRFLPFVAGLNIKTYPTKNKLKLAQQILL